jgi:hypothetical protein
MNGYDLALPNTNMYHSPLCFLPSGNHVWICFFIIYIWRTKKQPIVIFSRDFVSLGGTPEYWIALLVPGESIYFWERDSIYETTITWHCCPRTRFDFPSKQPPSWEKIGILVPFISLVISLKDQIYNVNYRWIREQVNQFGYSWVLFSLIYSPARWPLQKKNKCEWWVWQQQENCQLSIVRGDRENG